MQVVQSVAKWCKVVTLQNSLSQKPCKACKVCRINKVSKVYKVSKVLATRCPKPTNCSQNSVGSGLSREMNSRNLVGFAVCKACKACKTGKVRVALATKTLHTLQTLHTLLGFPLKEICKVNICANCRMLQDVR